jgi:hypothetical protein
MACQDHGEPAESSCICSCMHDQFLEIFRQELLSQNIYTWNHLYAAQDDLVRRCHNISTVASGLFMAQLLLWCFRTDNFEASHIPFSQMYAVNKHRSHPKFFIMHTINFTRNEHWQCRGHNVSETCLWTTGRTWSLILQVIWLFLEQVHFVRNVSRQDLPSQASWEHWSWTGTTAKHCFSWLPGLMRHIL